jgi:hypothetical protein
MLKGKMVKLLVKWRAVKQERMEVERRKKQVEKENKTASSEFSEYDDEHEWTDDESDDPSYIYVEEEEDWNEERMNIEKPMFKNNLKYDDELKKYPVCKKNN